MSDHDTRITGGGSRLASPPREVGLFGLGYYTMPVLDLCRAAGVNVRFVVDDQPAAHPDYALEPTDVGHVRKDLQKAGVPLLSAGELFSRLQRNEIDFPLIASRIISSQEGDSFSADSFLRSARMIREVTDGRTTLLHPIILARLLPPVNRKRFTLFGFPGSGNILAKHLLREIWERIPEPIPPRANLLAGLARHYHRSTMALILQLLQELRPTRLELTPTQFPTLDLSASLESGEHLLVNNIPGHLHLDSVFDHLHAAPTQFAVEEMTRLGTNCAVIIRHPCDVILSWASKLSRPATPVLDHPQFLENITKRLAQWLRQLSQYDDRLTVLRYEDLIARKKDGLHAFAGKVGVSVSEAEIEEYYDRYLNRDLQTHLAPGHFYKGGAGKWREHFLPRHLAIVKAAGLDAICKRWGYDLTLDKSAEARRAPVGFGPTGQMLGAVPLEQFLNVSETLFVQEPSPLLITSFARNNDQSILQIERTVRQSLDELNRSVCAALNSSIFLDHLDAGGLGPDSPPWIPSIPWNALLPIFYPEEYGETFEELPRLVA